MEEFTKKAQTECNVNKWRTRGNGNVYSVIDIGSNTIRLTVYQVQEGKIDTVFHEKSTAGLAGYVNEKGKLSQAGIQRAVESLLRFRRILENLVIDHVAVFATASLRNVVNTDEALTAIEQQTGFHVDILSGEKEALLDHIGATHFLPAADGLLLDIGGGSTELVFSSAGVVQKAVSLPIGSLNMYHKYVSYVLPTASERRRIERRIDKELGKVDLPMEACPVVCGVGGTVRATCKLLNTWKKLPTSNRTVGFSAILEFLETVRPEEKESLLPILKSAPDRIHTLLPGMTILSKLGSVFGCETMIVSDYGVREGYLLSEVLQVERRDDQWKRK